MKQIIKKTILMLFVLSIIAAGIPAAIAQTNVTGSPTATLTVTPNVTAPAPTEVKEGKFRVGPSVTLRPVIDVIETNQDGIVELFMNNPSLNDVTLTVDAQVSVPSGIHVYGESFGQGAGAGVVAGTFTVPPGTSRTISMTIKADKSARIGSHTLQFTGLYYPGSNKDNFQPLSLTYSVTVKEPSKNPEEAPSNAKPEAGKDIPLTWIILAAVVLGGIAIIFGLGRRPPKTEVNLQQ